MALMAIVGCTSLPRVGEPIQISPYVSQEDETRVSYSGEWSGNLERINWEIGDIIRISQEYNGAVTEALYRIKSFTNSGYRSQAQVEPVNDPLMYLGEGTYVYRGYYPGTAEHLNQDVYTFSVSATQTSDVKNDLFMVVANYSLNNEKVKLEFKPVVDAYEFILPAEVTKIQLESLRSDLSGDLTIQNNAATLNGNGKTITIDGITPQSKIRVFTLPQEVNSDNLFLRVYHSKGIKVYGLDNSAYPVFGMYKKYNFPAISSPITSSKIVNGVVSAEAHDKGLNWQFGDASKGEDPNQLYWTNQDNNNAWEPVPPEKLWEIIESVVDLKLTNTWEAKEITAEDLNVFPNLRTVDIDASNLESIEVKNPNITYLNVKSQTLKYVSVENCDGLTTFTMEGNYSIKDVTVSNNKNLIDFYIKSPTTNDNFYLLAENNESLTHFEIQQMSGWPPSVDWNAWGLTYRFDIKNCPAFKDYKVSNNAKTW